MLCIIIGEAAKEGQEAGEGMPTIPVYENEVLHRSVYGVDVMMREGGVYGVKDGVKLVYHTEMLLVKD